MVNLRIAVRIAPGDGRIPDALIDTWGRRYISDSEVNKKNKIIFTPEKQDQPPGGAAVNLVTYGDAGSDDANEAELTPVEWGYELCDQPIENPRWQ